MLWSEGKRVHPLRPELALTTASWVTALILLALNDHVLKQSGQLPGWFTGKLSDFAGLYVAPALLATLLRVQTRRALLACHLAVGAVFAATNLDPRAAALAAFGMRLFGFEWRIVTDAPDLIALPALIASQLWLGRHMARALPRFQPRLLPAARWALAGAGLFLCMATSDDDGPFSDTIGTQGPHLHNSSEETIVVLVQPLKSTVQLDCDVIGQEPAQRLPDAAFAPAFAYRLRPHENVGLGQSLALPGRCNAARIGGADLTPALVFWRSTDNLASFVPRSYRGRADYQPGAVVIEFADGEHTGYKSIEGDYVFALRRARPEIGKTCALPVEGARTAVSEELPVLGRARLRSVEAGPDGCVALRLETLFASRPPLDPVVDGGTDEDDAGTPVVPPPPVGGAGGGVTGAPLYVCVPPGTFPFVAGDVIDISLDSDGTRHFVKRDGDNLPKTELILARLRDTSFVAGLDIRVRPRMSCPYVRNETCAETAIAAEVTVASRGESFTLASGESPLRISQGASEIELSLPFAQRRVLLDTACALGAKAPGADVELVAVVRWGVR